MFEDLKPHLKELRKRLGYAVLALLLAFFVCFGFWEEIFSWMKAPIVEALANPKISGELVQVGVLEGVFMALRISFFAAIFFTMPVIFWQLWAFIAPGLYENEKKGVIPFVLFTSAMFLGGAAFCYYLVLPFVTAHILLFGSESFNAMISVGDYITFFTRFVIGFGLAFELPAISFFLGKLGLITDETLKNFFKFAVVLIFIFAALITPPDAISQILLAIPLMGLYGLSILIVKWVNPALKDESLEMESSVESKDFGADSKDSGAKSNPAPTLDSLQKTAAKIAAKNKK